MSEWIKCSEKLPEYGQDIIVFAPMTELISFRTVMQYLGHLNPSITYWMPLPKPPEDK